MKYDSGALADLKERLRIDRDSLDEEAIAQPQNFFHAAEGHAFAVSRRDAARHKLDVTFAELDKEIRVEMVAAKEKPTEASVKAEVARDLEYQKAQRAHLDACFEADQWEALKNAYRQRADMLRSLIGLYQSGYFGEVAGAAERRDALARFDQKRGRQ